MICQRHLVSCPDCIPVVVLKKCEPELSYILANSSRSVWKSLPDCCKVWSVVPVFKNVGERSAAKNCHPNSLLSVVSKVFEIPVDNRIIDHLEKCSLFSDFQYGFRSSRSTADLLRVVCDRFARVFNRFGATQAVAFGISRSFDRVWHAVVLHKRKSYGISGQIFGLISSFLSNRRLRAVLDGKSSQEIQLMLESLKAPFLILHFSCYTLMTFLMMLSVILQLNLFN